jgi:hypothetical protein
VHVLVLVFVLDVELVLVLVLVFELDVGLVLVLVPLHLILRSSGPCCRVAGRSLPSTGTRYPDSPP